MAVVAGIGIAESLFKIGAGLVGEAKDKKTAAQLKKTRPVASLNPEIKTNLGLQESELAGGDAQGEQAWREGTDSALGNSIGALIKSGATPNDVASVFANNNVGRQNMLKMREALRSQKVASLSSALGAEADDEKAVFDYNSRAWFDDAQANAQKTASDRALVGGGVSDAFATGTNAAALSNQKNQTTQTLAQEKQMYQDYLTKQQSQLDSYFKSTPVGTGGGTTTAPTYNEYGYPPQVITDEPNAFTDNGQIFTGK